MAQLILLVVAAAWLAVLIPPMLRSRVENRPNSSVTDFRRQLTKLQNTATPPRGAVRGMGRPLTQSPLSRPVAAGRPGQPQLRSGLTRHSTPSELAARSAAPAVMEPVDDTPRYRSHGDPTSGQRRPAPRQQRPQPDDRARRTSGSDPRRHSDTRRVAHDEWPREERRDGARTHGQVRRAHGDPTGGRRRPSNSTGEIRTPAKQRRMNVMFVLLIVTVCTLFLAATSGSAIFYYAFALSFLGLVGYVWMLAQARQRELTGASDGWLESY